MPFIPHTEDDIREMLAVIGVADIDTLFDEIPAELRCGELKQIPEGLSEMEISRLMQARAREDGQPLCFIGAGAYDHHIPAAVWQLATRGEFYTAYTPYQAEASQGTLQLLYEFQSMMTALTGMDVSNTSLYDGASALAEAVLMAVRSNRKSKSKRILIPRTLHPTYRKVTQAIVRNQKIELVEVPFDEVSGQTDLSALAAYAGEDFAALVIPQPNFFGVLESVDDMTDWAHENGMLAIAVVNPVALAVLKPPGEWGIQGAAASDILSPATPSGSQGAVASDVLSPATPSGSQGAVASDVLSPATLPHPCGADICCGEGQPLGAPLASGGPYFGFLCATTKLVRQMPGRIIGRTLDLDGNTGYTLTLQAREQHIRRSKATSNICTNQGLVVTAATIHMALLGAEGLERVAAACHANTQKLTQALTSLHGVEAVFQGACFHEKVVRLPIKSDDALKLLAAHNVLGGYDLNQDYPELGNAVLVCATELRSEDDIESYRSKLERVIQAQVQTPCQLKPDW